MADVLIVGRPNVGKSTLFNRLIKRRKSIVHDLPGVTRDMVEGIAHWRGKSFSVADTGGVLERGDEITEAIKRQVQKVLEGAKAIIFVVDGREGLTAGDEYLARLIYPYKDKVFVAVNKIDSQKLEDRVYEFYSLGFERLFPISAQHGRGVDELLDKLVEILPEEEERPLEGIKIAFLGRPNVGKSSLVNALLKEERVIVSPIPGTTRDAIEVPFSFEGKDFILVDTAGIRRRSKVEYGVEFFSVGRSIRAIELSNLLNLLYTCSYSLSFFSLSSPERLSLDNIWSKVISLSLAFINSSRISSNSFFSSTFSFLLYVFDIFWLSSVFAFLIYSAFNFSSVWDNSLYSFSMLSFSSGESLFAIDKRLLSLNSLMLIFNMAFCRSLRLSI